MIGPTRGLTPEETTLFIAELEQRLSEATGADGERVSRTLSLWQRMVADGAPAATAGYSDDGAPVVGFESALRERSA